MSSQTDALSDAWNPEHALVATLLAMGDTAAISLASEEVSPADFREERCALTYEAILALDAAGREVNSPNVTTAPRRINAPAQAAILYQRWARAALARSLA